MFHLLITLIYLNHVLFLLLCFPAYGQGHQSLASRVDYNIISSLSNPLPTAFAGTNPIHIQLENDPSVSQRYVQISMMRQIIVTGLSIETPENMALQSFSFSYADRSVQFPTSIQKFTRLFGDTLVS